MKKHILTLLIMTFLIAGCNDEKSNCENGKLGTLKNLTGFDGCGWVIQLSETLTLEPINLNDFDIELVNNKSVCVQYQINQDAGSICMVGVVVEIEKISDFNATD